MPVFAATIFVSAFLLFQVQPLMGKYILPWFGGSPAVWTACMLFFQVVLLCGYAYAHYSRENLSLRSQATLHIVLLLAALLFLPITPSSAFKPSGSGNPTIQILWLLTANIGLPFLVLSATGPLLQHWFAQFYPQATAYRLYALSNTGSLLALLSFPCFVEPYFTRAQQSHGWTAGWVLYAVCCLVCSLKMIRFSAQLPYPLSTPSSAPEPDSTRPLQRFLWLLLPACASVLLLSITNKLCQDVAVVPFLWVLPLAIYLLSFIISFDSPRWYVRTPFALALVAALSALTWTVYNGATLAVWKQITLYCSGLFVCCMVCHGELYRLRPPSRHLTAFYLVIAVGGAFGGLFVALAAPLFFQDFFELHWGLFLTALLFLGVCLNDRASEQQPPSEDRCTWDNWRTLACLLTLAAFIGLDRLFAVLGSHHRNIPGGWLLALRIGTWSVLALFIISWVARGQFKNFVHWRFVSTLWAVTGVTLLGTALYQHAAHRPKNIVRKSRSFYGVLTVLEYNRGDPLSHYFLLQHGRITHGLQFAEAPPSEWPTTYYTEKSGAGAAIAATLPFGRRVGVVGLGVGTMASYTQFGDSIRFYEINPEVIRLAATDFTYLSDTTADVTIALGDARLSLEREAPQDYDVLVLDAFSSDSIPVHLLTREAFEVYGRHLNRHGILAVHVSNRYLDLQPIVTGLANAFNYQCVLIDQPENKKEWWIYPSLWLLLTKDALVAQDLYTRFDGQQCPYLPGLIPLWTDDFTSLYQILK